MGYKLFFLMLFAVLLIGSVSAVKIDDTGVLWEPIGGSKFTTNSSSNSYYISYNISQTPYSGFRVHNVTLDAYTDFTVQARATFFYINGSNSSVDTVSLTGSYVTYNLTNPNYNEPIKWINITPFNGNSDRLFVKKIFFTLDSFTNITLNSPANNTNHFSSILFNSTISTSYSLSNATIYIWNSTGIFNQTKNALTGVSSNTTTWNITNFALGTYYWNVLGCGTNSTSTACAFASTNNTFTWGYLTNSESWATSTAEGVSNTYSLNITTATGISIITASFSYNNTLYSPSITQVGNNYILTRDVTSPLVSANTYINLFWNVTFNDGTNIVTSNHSQLVNNVLFDNCITNHFIILNYSLFDEDTRTFINAVSQNSTIELDVRASALNAIDNSNPIVRWNMSYNKTNPVQVCAALESLNNTNYRLDAIARYITDSRVSEFDNIQNITLSNNTAPQNIYLYDLLTTSSQQFKITVTDSDFNPLANAVVVIQRQFIPFGEFTTVERPMTDYLGNAIGHFVLSGTIYRIIIMKNNQILYTTSSIQPLCNNAATGDCTIALTILGGVSSGSNFQTDNGVTYSWNFNSTTRIINFNFATIDGTTHTFVLNGTIFSNYNNNTICTNSLVASTGTLSCTILPSYGNVTIFAQVYKDGTYIANNYFSLGGLTSDAEFGGSRVIMVMILFLTLGLMALSSGIATILLGLVGLIIAITLNIYNGGTGSLGLGYTFIWLFIAAALIIYKIMGREG